MVPEELRFELDVDSALKQGLQVQADVRVLAIDQADSDEEFIRPRVAA